MNVTFEMVRSSPEIRTYITQADASLLALGYTEHSFAHVTKCAELASSILAQLDYDQRQVELARIAGYMHDIGNVVNRHDHALSGATMAFRILDKMGMEPPDVAAVITAIGHRRAGERGGRGADPGGQVRRAPQPGAQPGHRHLRHPRPGELLRGALRGAAGPAGTDRDSLPLHQHGGVRRHGLF